MINIFQPSLKKEELHAVDRVFQSNWIGRGSETTAFETEFATHLGVATSRSSFVKTVSCCSAGLFHTMKLLDIQPGD